MSYVRTILGRFARLLLRIARRLDSNVVPKSDPNLAERMAALRMRYAGAPAHWLEAVARRVAVADPPGAPHRPLVDPPLGETTTTPSKSRPMPTFPQPDAHSRRPIQFEAASTERPAFPRLPRTERSRRGRPQLVFRDIRRNSGPANPPRLERRPRWDRQLRFHSNPPPHDRALNTEPGASDRLWAPRDSERSFPALGEGKNSTDPTHELGREPSPPAKLHLEQAEELARSERIEPVWNVDHDAEPRPSPQFAEPVNRWPDLPSLEQLLVDEDAGRLLGRDEAAIVAEQTVGTWSE